MDAIAKLLSHRLPTLEIVWARFLFYALAVVPFAIRRHGRAALRPSHVKLQLLRGALLALSALTFFSAIARMPLADAMAIFFVYPLVILVLSNLLLAESIGLFRWAMVLVGFAGAALASKPTFAGISPAILFALASSGAYAGALLVTRRLASADPSLVTVSVSALIGFLGYSCALPLVWTAPSLRDWGLMALMGAIAAVGHFLIVAAHRLTTASRLAPYGYMEIVAAVFFGWLLFHDWPGPAVWAGIVIIVASGLMSTLRDGRAVPIEEGN